MGQNREWDLELEESAQGIDSYRAPGAAAQLDEAREASIEATAGRGEISGERSRLGSARVRRRELGEAMNDLESALSGPMAAEGWLEKTRRSIQVLGESLSQHIEVTEGRDGFLEEIRRTAPRLSNEIALIETEHRELLAMVDKAEAAIEQSNDRKAIRNRALAILPRLSMHRHRGADLVYEAYNVDIAAGD